jgi:hypothetical protein
MVVAMIVLAMTGVLVVMFVLAVTLMMVAVSALMIVSLGAVIILLMVAPGAITVVALFVVLFVSRACMLTLSSLACAFVHACVTLRITAGMAGFDHVIGGMAGAAGGAGFIMTGSAIMNTHRRQVTAFHHRFGGRFRAFSLLSVARLGALHDVVVDRTAHA